MPTAEAGAAAAEAEAEEVAGVGAEVAGIAAEVEEEDIAAAVGADAPPVAHVRPTAGVEEVEIVRPRSAATQAAPARIWGHPRRRRVRRHGLPRRQHVPEAEVAIAPAAVAVEHKLAEAVNVPEVRDPATSTSRVREAVVQAMRDLAEDRVISLAPAAAGPASTIDLQHGQDREAAASPIDRPLAPDRGEPEHNGREPARAREAIVRALGPVRAAAARNVREFDPAAATESPAVAIVRISRGRGIVPARTGDPAIAPAGTIRDASTTGRTG